MTVFVKLFTGRSLFVCAGRPRSNTDRNGHLSAVRQVPALPLHVGHGRQLRSPLRVLELRRSLGPALDWTITTLNSGALPLLLRAANGLLQVRRDL